MRLEKATVVILVRGGLGFVAAMGVNLLASLDRLVEFAFLVALLFLRLMSEPRLCVVVPLRFSILQVCS